MTTPFAEACQRPFSNGTEGDAWMAKWCTYCARDHAMHMERGDDGEWHECGDPADACRLILASMCGEWPEGWIPEPDDGSFSLPSRLICTAFTPCEPCGGDPGAEARAERVAEVTVYWRDRGAA